MERFVGATNRQLRLDSMEPWSFSHGNRPLIPTSDNEMIPSMEPWPFSHGNVLVHARSMIVVDRLQWSHGPLAMETSLAVADASRHRVPSMEPWPFSHGNGQERVLRLFGELVPSMEPWPFSHGNA